MLREDALRALDDLRIGPRGEEPEHEHEREPRHEHDRGEREVDLRHRSIESVARALVRVAIASLVVAAWSAIGAHAQERIEPRSYDVDARVDRADARIAVSERVVVWAPPGTSELRLWSYADRTAVAPREMEERSYRWIYPGEMDPGSVDVRVARVDGASTEARWERGEQRDFAGGDIVVEIAPSDAGREVVIELELELALPDRFGRLGRDGATIALAAPWYPLIVDGDTWAHRVPHRVRVRVGDADVWAGEAIARGEVSAARDTTYVPVLIAPRLYERRVPVDGATLRWIDDQPIWEPPAITEEPSSIVSLDVIDDAGLAAEVAVDVVRTARWLELPVPSEIPVVVVHSRTELAATMPGAVMASDRLFEIFPLDEVRQFHRRALRRALFSFLAQSISDRVEPAADRGWADDLRAVVLLDLDETRRQRATQRPDQLLSLLAFHPAVDQLLYAPQIAFEDAYFSAIDEPDRFRDDPVRARFPLARGRRVLECARDALGDEALTRLIARLVRGRRSARESITRVSADAGARVDEWLAYATREVNYRLGAIESERAADGSWVHRVEVIRDGDPRREPVEVEVEDAAGNHVIERWDGEGDRAIVTITTPAERSRVAVDPAQRLPQSARIADGHPRADDATSQPFRPPIITAFSLDVLVSERNVTGLIDFAIRQRYDLEHTVAFRLSRTVARTGGRVRYLQGIGPKAHTNRRIGLVGGGIGFNYVQPGFGGSELGGYATDLFVSASVDTRRFIHDPREGFSLAGDLTLTGTVREDGSFALTGRGAFRGSVTLGLGLLNALCFFAGGGFTAGPALDADRQSIGGRYVLRGFANDELLGNGTLYLVAEHRFTAVTDLAINVLHGVWAREIQLAWWLGAGVVFDSAPRADMAGGQIIGAAEVGAGVRVHYDYGGVQPGLIAIDVGLPVSRWAQQGTNGGRNPLGFYVSFDQFF